MHRLFGAVLLCLVLGTTAASSLTCDEGQAICRAACTPDRIARYHEWSERRCTASCAPRFHRCLATGVSADLEKARSGWYEPVTGWW